MQLTKLISSDVGINFEDVDTILVPAVNNSISWTCELQKQQRGGGATLQRRDHSRKSGHGLR